MPKKVLVISLLAALAEDCGHEDWHEIYAFLERFRGLPASTLAVSDSLPAATSFTFCFVARDPNNSTH